MTYALPILTFIVGIFCGMGILGLGLWLGYKMSVDIRNIKSDTEVHAGLFTCNKDPAEFQLLEDQEEEDDSDLDNEDPDEEV